MDPNYPNVKDFLQATSTTLNKLFTTIETKYINRHQIFFSRIFQLACVE